MMEVLMEYYLFHKLYGRVYTISRPYLFPSWQYEKAFCFCVKRKGLYHLQILWAQIF